MMMPKSDPPFKLEVGRTGLIQALKIVAQVIKKTARHIGLTLEDGCLCIDASETTAKVPASGVWPSQIFVGASWVRLLAKKMPPGDPLVIRVEGERIYLGRYSERCAFTASEPNLIPALPQVDESRIIADAARILKPLHIKTSDLEELVSKTRAKGSEVHWTSEEKRMIPIVARAWVLLAPLGIETPDIHRLVQKAVRNAWK